MAVELSNITMPMAALLASLIGAAATLTASFLNIRANLKKELLARANANKAATKRTSRTRLILLPLTVAAAAVAGFALSQQLASKERASTEALEAELRARIEQLTASTQRLEAASMQSMSTVVQQVRDEERRRRGVEGVVAAVMLERCIATLTAGFADCDENMAHPVRVCAEVPFEASVTAIDLYARLQGDTRPWAESRVTAGTDFGGGRFTERVTESIVDGTTKHVCQELLFWNSDRSVDARILVRYNLPT